MPKWNRTTQKLRRIGENKTIAAPCTKDEECDSAEKETCETVWLNTSLFLASYKGIRIGESE